MAAGISAHARSRGSRRHLIPGRPWIQLRGAILRLRIFVVLLLARALFAAVTVFVTILCCIAARAPVAPSRAPRARARLTWLNAPDGARVEGLEPGDGVRSSLTSNATVLSAPLPYTRAAAAATAGADATR